MLLSVTQSDGSPGKITNQVGNSRSPGKITSQVGNSRSPLGNLHGRSLQRRLSNCDDDLQLTR